MSLLPASLMIEWMKNVFSLKMKSSIFLEYFWGGWRGCTKGRYRKCEGSNFEITSLVSLGAWIMNALINQRKIFSKIYYFWCPRGPRGLFCVKWKIHDQKVRKCHVRIKLHSQRLESQNWSTHLSKIFFNSKSLPIWENSGTTRKIQTKKDVEVWHFMIKHDISWSCFKDEVEHVIRLSLCYTRTFDTSSKSIQ